MGVSRRSAWVQVSVRAGREGPGCPQRRLVLSGVVPVADLLPDLLDALALDGPEDWRAGLQVRVCGGGVLAWSDTLTARAVADGSVLVIDTPRPPVLHDDLVEAVAEQVRDTARTPEQGRQFLAGVAAVAVLWGAGALVVQGPGLVPCLVLAGTAGAAGATAIGIRHRTAPAAQGPTSAAVVLALAVVLVGLTAAELPLGLSDRGRLGAAGVAVLGLGLGCCGWARFRAVGVAAVLLGTVAVALVVALDRLEVDPARLLGVLVPMTALVGAGVPQWVLTRTPGGSVGEAPGPGASLDARWLASSGHLERAGALWQGWTVACTVVLVAGSWWVAERGVPGVVAVGGAAVSGWLRARPAASEAVRGCALAGLLGSTAVLSCQAVRLDAAWASPWALGLVTVAGLAATWDLVPAAQPQARERCLAVVERLVLAGLVPAAVLAGGLWPGIG